MQVKEIDIQKVSQFSARDKAYISGDPSLQHFYKYPFDFEALDTAIEQRRQYDVDRSLLSDVLASQYSDVSISEKTRQNLEWISSDKCFTVTTAHQPSLMTGPLYYVFKILSTINITNRLRQTYPDLHFVPVFVMGGEDHDFEEINHFHLFGNKLEWKNKGGGPVGRRSTNGLEEILDQTLDILGDTSKAAGMVNQLKEMLPACENYGDFSFRLTHLLFDHLGLVVLRMDDSRLKAAFTGIVKEEILDEVSKPIVNKAQAGLQDAGFDQQAYARNINFFYLGDGYRNRIEREKDLYHVLDTDISFTKEELEKHIDAYPERFSPNVVMRPLYQELILPNLAYVGGGGEIAYWLERKEQFEHFGIHFPMLVRRVSAAIAGSRVMKNIEKINLGIEDLFMEKAALVKHYLEISDAPDYRLGAFKKQINQVFGDMEAYIGDIDRTLVKTTRSENVKTQKSVEYLESKLKRSIKQMEETQLNRLDKTVEQLFPEGGLQERHANIFEYISMYGAGIIDDMLPHSNPFDKKFKVFILERP